MNKMVDSHIILLPDGRALSYGVYGTSSSTASLTVFYFHGFPSSHYEAMCLDEAARARDIRIIAPDRPGMNLSTFQADRTLKDWPADLLALADHAAIRADTFAMLGTSGGAPYVLACCEAISTTRLKCAAIISGLYPTSLGVQGMALESRVMLWLAPWATVLVEAIMDWGVASTVRHTTDPAKLEEVLGDGMKGRPEPDRHAWEVNEGGLREMLVASVQHAYPDGSAHGAAWDARLYGSPWGFELEDLSIGKGKMILWHGEEDANIPLAMAEKAHALLQDSELRVLAGESHMSLFLHKSEEALDELKKRAI